MNVVSYISSPKIRKLSRQFDLSRTKYGQFAQKKKNMKDFDIMHVDLLIFVCIPSSSKD